MHSDDTTVVLVHGAWADGSSWGSVIASLIAQGIKAVAAPLPLTSLADDVAAVGRTIARIDAPVVLVGHAYAGAVIGETRCKKIKALVYVAALAPDEGETVADVFYRGKPHPKAPKLGVKTLSSGSPKRRSPMHLPKTRRRKRKGCWRRSSVRLPFLASLLLWAYPRGGACRAGICWPKTIA